MPTSHYTPHYFKHRDHLDPYIATSIDIFASLHGLKKVLDVGCGTGLLVHYLTSHGFKSVGCDKYYHHRGIINCSATKLPFPKSSFDLVTSISVIEHLTPHEASLFLTEAYRVLRPGGYIFLITPNFASPFRLLLGKHWFAFSDPTHLTYYTPSSLSHFLTLQGFIAPNLRFVIAKDIVFDWHLPKLVSRMPNLVKYWLTYLLISSPLSTMRDSFWISARKPK